MSDRDRSKDKNGGKKKSGRGWGLRVFVLAVVLSALLSFFSTTALEGTGYVVAALVLAVFIGLGIVFDMIGVAVTAADPKPFHSMAAHKEKGAKAAIVTTEVCNAAARHRAAQLGIAVIDLEELKTGQLVHRLKVIMKAE